MIFKETKNLIDLTFLERKINEVQKEKLSELYMYLWDNKEDESLFDGFEELNMESFEALINKCKLQIELGIETVFEKLNEEIRNDC